MEWKSQLWKVLEVQNQNFIQFKKDWQLWEDPNADIAHLDL
jgi:hypothetical protein